MSEENENSNSLRDRLRRLEVDRSVLYAISSRGWQFLAGPVTLWLIAKFFSPDLQGFFYTFGSVLAMQLFFELGLATVLVNLVGHEWASLRLSEQRTVEGDGAAASRLASLIRMTGTWYSVCAVLFVAGTGLAGLWLFSEKQAGMPWQGPWWSVVVLSALAMRYIPRMAMLEACGQVRAVNQNRLLQAVTGSLVVWVAIGLDWGLWTCVASAAVRLFWEVVLVEYRFGSFFRSLKLFRDGPQFDWWNEAWPLQWRIAIQSVALWFANYLFTPVMFRYHSEAEAGQMGMTMQIVTAIQAAALAWVQTRVPVFGNLAASRDFAGLDRLFRQITIITTLFTVAAGAGVLGIIALLDAFEIPLAGRLLPLLPTALLLAAVSLNHVVLCQGLYVRAHKRDPFLVLGTSVCLLTGAAIWFFGRSHGVMGVAWAWPAVCGLVYLPLNSLVWWNQRRDLQRGRSAVNR